MFSPLKIIRKLALNLIVTSSLAFAALAVPAPQEMTGGSVAAEFRGEWVPAKAACTSSLKRHRIGDDIKPLKEGRSIGRALSEEEITKLRAKAAERPAWQAAYDAMILAVNTVMRGADIKALRWCDIDLFGRVLVVPKSKTAAGERSIPLTDEALKTLLNIRQRAVRPKSFGINEGKNRRVRI